MLESCEMLLEMAGRGVRGVIDGQMSLFDTVSSENMNIKIQYRPEYDRKKLLAMEKEAAGIYLTGNPLSEYEYLAQLLKVQHISEMTYDSVNDDEIVKLLCVIRERKLHETKKGSKMCFLTLEDSNGEIDAVVFPDLFLLSASKLTEDSVVYVNGRISKKDDGISVICGSITSDNEFLAMKEHKQLCIKTKSDNVPVNEINNVCQQYKGNTEICFYFTDVKKMVRPKNKLIIGISSESFNRLCEFIPYENMGLI